MSAVPTIMPELARYGPGSDRASPTAEEAWRYVRGLATGHYENFSVLSRLVPVDLQDDFAAVYAYCRWSDDLGDETGSDDEARARSLDLLDWWRSELRACFAAARGEPGEPVRHPVFVALAGTIRRRELAPEPFEHLIDAFEQDQRVQAYETWEQVLDYCTHSANPVGRIVLALGGRGGGAGDDKLVAMSDATCTALQLTNFWQDVRRDLLERGRVYVPSKETGVTPAMLRDWANRGDDPEARIAYITALRPLVERTRELFAMGRGLPGAMGDRLSPVVWLFGAGGESVLRAVDRCGCTTLWRRPVLSRWRKVSLVGAAVVGARVGRWSRRRGRAA